MRRGLEPQTKPGEACRLQADEIVHVLWDVLTEGDMRRALSDLAVWYPEVFQDLLLDLAQSGRVRKVKLPRPRVTV